jgi:hypothetical protein
MSNIKQTLTEELSKMNYLFGYKKGQVISEQQTTIPIPGIPTEPTEKQKEAAAAGWGPVTDEYAKTLPVGPDGKILPKPNSTKLTIRQLIEKDIANEKLGITWAQVKERFGSSGQSNDNQLLWKAWKGGWRPGKEVPEQLQTATYKQNNARMEPIGMKPIQPGAVGASTNSASADNTKTQVSPLVQQNTDIKTPEQAKAAVDQAQEQAKIAKQQKKLTQEMCRVVGRAINPIMPLKQGVANQELCDTLRQCMKDGLLVRDNSAFSACQAFPEKPITAPAAPAPTK